MLPFFIITVDPVTNDLAPARQKKSLVAESRWSQEWVFAVQIAGEPGGCGAWLNVGLMTATFTHH